MPSYSIAMTALAINAPAKWIDNAVSQNTADGVMSVKRGVPRRVSRAGLLLLALARELHVELGLGVADALAKAASLLEAYENKLQLGHLSVSVDVEALQRDIGRRAADALESAPVPRRGRPRREK